MNSLISACLHWLTLLPLSMFPQPEQVNGKRRITPMPVERPAEPLASATATTTTPATPTEGDETEPPAKQPRRITPVPV